ncbi:MAG: hypothetical protein ACP5PZ_11595 [Bacteroidales bacterium]
MQKKRHKRLSRQWVVGGLLRGAKEAVLFEPRRRRGELCRARRDATGVPNRVGLLSLDFLLLLHQGKRRGMPVGSSSGKLVAEKNFLFARMNLFIHHPVNSKYF